jgi:hypothetical protein
MSTNLIKLVLDLKSFEYFKICGDLEEVAIIKSVSNRIYYLHEFFRIFYHFISIFIARKTVFRFIFESGKSAMWGPRVGL